MRRVIPRMIEDTPDYKSLYENNKEAFDGAIKEVQELREQLASSEEYIKSLEGMNSQKIIYMGQLKEALARALGIEDPADIIMMNDKVYSPV